MKKKGFTLVELLVVIAIIALLMGILMPALARVRQIAYRLYCGTNLSGIGKAMLIYSNDYDDEMPRAGGRSSTYFPTIANWRNVSRQLAFGLLADGSGGKANMTSNFYLLIKYSEVTPKSFLCKGDSGVTEFKPSDEVPPLTGVELIDLWDFGSVPQSHCSYAYHFPYGVFALTSSSEPGMAVASDPNPWQGTPGQLARAPTDFPLFKNGTDRESIKKGNGMTHQEDGQNVLFMDGHSSFEKSSRCGVDDDNIYTKWLAGTPIDKRSGTYAVALVDPAGRTDSFLVTDGAAGGTTTTTTTR